MQVFLARKEERADRASADTEWLHPLEIAALNAASRADREIEVAPEEVRSLVAERGYCPSFGGPLNLRHYRRSLGNGACLHLIMNGEQARLHCDRFDPHRNPASLLLHLLVEAPRETLANLAAGWTVLRSLLR